MCLCVCAFLVLCCIALLFVFWSMLSGQFQGKVARKDHGCLQGNMFIFTIVFLFLFVSYVCLCVCIAFMFVSLFCQGEDLIGVETISPEVLLFILFFVPYCPQECLVIVI